MHHLNPISESNEIPNNGSGRYVPNKFVNAISIKGVSNKRLLFLWSGISKVTRAVNGILAKGVSNGSNGFRACRYGAGNRQMRSWSGPTGPTGPMLPILPITTAEIFFVCLAGSLIDCAQRKMPAKPPEETLLLVDPDLDFLDWATKHRINLLLVRR